MSEDRGGGVDGSVGLSFPALVSVGSGSADPEGDSELVAAALGCFTRSTRSGVRRTKSDDFFVEAGVADADWQRSRVTHGVGADDEPGGRGGSVLSFVSSYPRG
jgi:hypothetical protein